MNSLQKSTIIRTDAFTIFFSSKKWKIKISRKLSFSIKTVQHSWVKKKMRKNNTFFELYGFTSLSGGNHGRRFTAGWTSFILFFVCFHQCSLYEPSRQWLGWQFTAGIKFERHLTNRFSIWGQNIQYEFLNDLAL